MIDLYSSLDRFDDQQNLIKPILWYTDKLESDLVIKWEFFSICKILKTHSETLGCFPRRGVRC